MADDAPDGPENIDAGEAANVAACAAQPGKWRRWGKRQLDSPGLLTSILVSVVIGVGIGLFIARLTASRRELSYKIAEHSSVVYDAKLGSGFALVPVGEDGVLTEDAIDLAVSESVYTVLLQVTNTGNHPIQATDIYPKDPIRLKLEGQGHLLDVRLRYASNDKAGVTFNKVSSSSGVSDEQAKPNFTTEYEFNWDILEASDWLVLQLTYVADTELTATVTGSIKGFAEGRSRVVKVDDTRSVWSVLLDLIFLALAISLVMLFPILIYSRAGAREQSLGVSGIALFAISLAMVLYFFYLMFARSLGWIGPFTL